MTALKGYDRLEATGLWRDAPESQRRNVYVFLRDASLVIADRNETALAHWSLPAVERLNPGQRPALLSPGTEATETLELDDPTMIDAIEQVQAALRAAAPKPGRLRFWAGMAMVAGLVLGGTVWLPGALVKQADNVVPFSKRVEIGGRILGYLDELTGGVCATSDTSLELRRLALRLQSDPEPTLIVMRDLPALAMLLPGRLVLLDERLLGRDSSPEALAGHALLQLELRRGHSAMSRILERGGMLATFRFLVSGDIPDDRLAAHAVSLTRSEVPAEDMPEAEQLVAAFAARGMSTTPMAQGLDPSLTQRAEMMALDPFPTGSQPPLLTDNGWVTVQEICE